MGGRLVVYEVAVERSDPFQDSDSLPVLARPALRVSPLELPAGDILPVVEIER